MGLFGWGKKDKEKEKSVQQSPAAVTPAASKAAEAAPAPQPEEKKKGLFARLVEGLSKTRGNMTEKVDTLVKETVKIDEDFYESLEDILIMSDCGIKATTRIMDEMRKRVDEKNIKDGNEAREILKQIMVEEMDIPRPPLKWPMVMLVVGVNGVGKTTTIGKLALRFQTIGRRVMLCAGDTFRAAAAEQLTVWSQRARVPIVRHEEGADPAAVLYDAIQSAKAQEADLLLVDTAGRLHVDEAMMDEIKQVHAAINPVETLFVVDAMTGQDAANTAKAFNEALPLTGVVLTKVDGDARGGAALSIRHITGKPIKFLGVGEKTEALEPFHPDRIASRILGMGDVLSLIEDIESKVDRAQAEKLATKLKKGDGFDLTDFLEQLRQMKNMGGMASLMGKLPGMGQIPDNVKSQMDDKVLVRMEAIINSMTLKERAKPEIIKGSRKRRIAAGCGMQVQDVNRLLKQFDDMQRMMKKMKKGGMAKMMRGMKGMMPPGFPGR